jgi:hypothetical protein
MTAQFDSSRMVGLLMGGLFFLAWLSIMGSFLYFTFRVAPTALGRWAVEEGYQIVRRRDARFLDQIRNQSGSGVRLYRVIVRDKSGQVREALVRIGKPLWFSLRTAHCPVEVLRWRDNDPTRSADSASKRDLLWDRDLDA